MIYHNKKLIWVWLLIGFCGVLYPGYVDAASGIVIDLDRMEFVEIDAKVMEVNLKKSYMIVGEKKFLITNFKIGKKMYKSALVDAGGDSTALNSFKKGERVIIKGIKLPKGDHVAGFVQKKSAGYKKIIHQRFAPRARSMSPAE